MAKSSLKSAIYVSILLLVAFQSNAKAQTTAPPEAVAASEPEVLKPWAFVNEDGRFQYKFSSFKEAREATSGNEKNRITKESIELIYLNSRCNASDGVTYSYAGMNRVGTEALVKKYFDRWGVDLDARGSEEQLLINEIQIFLSAKWFPRKAECDAIPIMLSIGNYDGIWLEDSDAQNRLIGNKLNDGAMYVNLTEDNSFADRVRAGEKDPKFFDKYGYNRFFDIQIAVNAALLQPSKNKLLISDGSKIMLYGFGNFSPDYNLKDAAFDAQFDVFKKAKMRKGWTIIAVVLGQNKIVKINDPAVP